MFFLASNRGSIKKRKNYREKDKEENYDREGGGGLSPSRSTSQFC